MGAAGCAGVGLAAAPAAGAAGRSCGTVRVSARSTLRIMFGPPGALAQRGDTAYVVSTTTNSCAGAWRLLQTVVPAGDERAAIRARGFRVVGLDRFGPGGARFHRVIVARGGERVSYVRAGGDWVDGLGLGGGLGGVAPIRCARRYQVLGLRGSGQKLDGPFGMAGTVGAVAEAMVSELGGGPVERSRSHIPRPAPDCWPEVTQARSLGLCTAVTNCCRPRFTASRASARALGSPWSATHRAPRPRARRCEASQATNAITSRLPS